MIGEDAPRLVELLEPGEAVLWSGQPHYPYFRSEAHAAFVVGLIALAAATVPSLMLPLLIHDAFRKGPDNLVKGLPILLIAGAGFGYYAWQGLSKPWTAPRRVERAFYAVTDRKVIMSGGVGYARNGMVPTPHNPVYYFTPDQVRAREIRKRSGGRVDIVLATEKNPGARGRFDIGILGAEDWQGAEAAMEAAFGHQ